MRTLEQLLDRLQAYGQAEYIYDPALGYVAWHFATGDNVELLFIESAVPNNGHGVELVRRMALRILELGRAPYQSVFAFRLGSNEAAGKFYRGLGWQQVNLGRSIYRDVDTILAWITWSNLLERFNLKEQEHA